MSMELLIAHLFGDYILQSDWMASEKRKSVFAAMIHAAFYTIPFLFITTSFTALMAIAGSHAIIDHFGLARFVVWGKNFIAPVSRWPPPWGQCRQTGYDSNKPAWMSVWLMIIADNSLHLLCNYLAVTLL